MKKLFLIPLLACFTCAMAWGVEVTDKTSLQNALNAGGEITLGADINLGASQVTMTSGTVVLDLNGHTLTGAKTNYAATDGTLNITGGNLTINATNGGGIDNTGSKGAGIAISNGANLIVNGGTFHGTYEGIIIYDAEVTVNGGIFPTPGDNNIWLYTGKNGKATIKGGTFNGASGWCCFQVDANTELDVENLNATKNAGANSRIFYSAGSTAIINITGGVFNGENPAAFVDFAEALMVKDGDTYTVSSEINGKVYNFDTYAVYNSLQDAVDAANNGNHILILENSLSATVSKNLTFDLGGNSATISAGAGFQKSVNGDFVAVMASDNLGAYLNGDDETPFSVSANINLDAIGLVRVKGTKKITINSGVTVSGTYKVRYPSILVPNGAKLTIEGDGTIAADRNPIIVEKGGELVIGKADKSDQLKINTSTPSPVNLAITNYGKTTINNAEIHAKSAVAQNYGDMEILGGLYTGEASVLTAHKYCITSDNEGQLTLKNSIIKGAHGAVCIQGLDMSKKAGTGRIENCELIATNNPNGNVLNTTSIHYALYSATGGVVSVYNTKMKSTQQPQAIHIGNNDAYNTFGLVYLYEGCMVKAPEGKRIWVQKKTALDKDVLFPISVDESSAWYTAAQNGGEGPLPAGYQWEAINEGDEGYSDGYRWKVVSTAASTKEADDDPSATIPWQQSSTWDATASSASTEDVPAATTAVTIPEGKVVVISNDPTKNNGISEAVAEQVILGGEGASLTVQEGTSLNVSNGVNIADGAKLVVDAGAIVTIGAGGLVAANEEAVEVKMTEGKTGTFMIAPAVTENTHPMAKVELVSKAYKRGENDYVWQRFGVPAYMQGVTRGSMIYDHVAAPTSVMKLDYENRTWAPMANDDEFIPFRCYDLTTTATTAGAVYTFTCPLMGNGDAELELVDDWNYYANSYTAPIDIPTLLANFKEHNANVSATVYLYRAEDNWWDELNEGTYIFPGDYPTQIAPMQAFIFNRIATGANPVVDYKNNVWDPIMSSAPAPARARKSYKRAMVEITAADGAKDIVRLIEDNQFSAGFDNSYDAAKYMNENSFNLFVDANSEKYGIVATDNLEGTTISMTTKGQTSFTMTVSMVDGMNYAIRDMLTGTEIEMAEGATYMFSVPANASVEGRFMIVPVANMPTAIDNIEATAAVKGIYTVTGQFVGNDYHSLPNGIYVVDGKKIVK